MEHFLRAPSKELESRGTSRVDHAMIILRVLILSIDQISQPGFGVISGDRKCLRELDGTMKRNGKTLSTKFTAGANSLTGISRLFETM